MILIWLPVLVVVLDRLTKWIVTTHMRLHESIPVIEEVFHITYILNPGAAFGILAHNRWFFLLVGALVLVVAAVFARQILEEDRWIQAGTGLFLGGTIGNLWDRLVDGKVIDMFDFRIWPVFNVADIAICVGVGCILWSVLRTEMRKKK